MAYVIGYSLVPEPPANMIPFIFKICSNLAISISMAKIHRYFMVFAIVEKEFTY
jgi:hypothetical protein